MRKTALLLLLAMPVQAQETKVPVYIVDETPKAGPPAPKDPAIALLEARLEEHQKVSEGTLWDAVIIAPGASADLYTTGEKQNCRELNPAIADRQTGRPNSLKAVALKAAVYPLEVAAAFILRKFGHHNWARGLAWALTGMHTGIAIWNLSQDC